MTGAVLVVDAANVIGSRPDGWWRDRAGAASRLLERIGIALEAGGLEGPVVVVLEGRARDATDPPASDRLRVVRAARSGDDAIADLVAGASHPGPRPTVVTADRALADEVRRLGSEVESPSRFLKRLP